MGVLVEEDWGEGLGLVALRICCTQVHPRMRRIDPSTATTTNDLHPMTRNPYGEKGPSPLPISFNACITHCHSSAPCLNKHFFVGWTTQALKQA